MKEKLRQFQCMQVRVADKKKKGIPGTVMVEPKSCPRADDSSMIAQNPALHNPRVLWA